MDILGRSGLCSWESSVGIIGRSVFVHGSLNRCLSCVHAEIEWTYWGILACVIRSPVDILGSYGLVYREAQSKYWGGQAFIHGRRSGHIGEVWLVFIRCSVEVLGR